MGGRSGKLVGGQHELDSSLGHTSFDPTSVTAKPGGAHATLLFPPVQDRLPWLLKIRASAKLLTTPEALSTLTHPTHATTAKPTDELALALAKVHPGSIAPARERSKAKRRAVVVGCSALKVAYRDLLSGKGEAGGEALETYFIYREWMRSDCTRHLLTLAAFLPCHCVPLPALFSPPLPTDSARNPSASAQPHAAPTRALLQARNARQPAVNP